MKPEMTSTRVAGDFWGGRLAMNATVAIYHQWEQIEASGCIDNFRIAAGQKDGFREGFFFADSDAYKWLEAASRILADRPDPRLQGIVDDLISLLEAAQMEDGYLDTYNQIHFPGQRWVNLQIEHEFYCLGHLIEAGIAHHQATGTTRFLALVCRAADLLVRDFMEASPLFTDGHEEIELALLRLYRHTGEQRYLDLGQRLIERRGRIKRFPLEISRQFKHFRAREKLVQDSRAAYLKLHPEYASFKLPPTNPAYRLPRADLRQKLSHLSGKYFQQHAPIRKQTVPVGHSVRFTYLETAASMLAAETGDTGLLDAIERVWRRMVARRMYVTGGLGALPFIEGFGRDYELDPEAAYAETCAALGSMFWNLELARQTGDPCYADLFEWQLYNAASVGMGYDGRSYLYNNPMACQTGKISRQSWYLVPCCPSNLSRTWGSLGRSILHRNGSELHIFQYISSETSLDEVDSAVLSIKSGVPWDGRVAIEFQSSNPAQYTLNLRIPSWAGECTLRLNGQPVSLTPDPGRKTLPETACDYNPTQARSLRLERLWQPGDLVELTFEMPLRLYRQHPRLPGCGNMFALGRGPLVYCLESIDQPGIDLAGVFVDVNSLHPEMDESLFGGTMKITGRSLDGVPLTLIPYAMWGNRGLSAMTVFFRG